MAELMEKKKVWEVRADGFDHIMGSMVEYGEYIPAHSISDAWEEFRDKHIGVTFWYLQINEVKHFERSKGIPGAD